MVYFIIEHEMQLSIPIYVQYGDGPQIFYTLQILIYVQKSYTIKNTSDYIQAKERQYQIDLSLCYAVHV